MFRCVLILLMINIIILMNYIMFNYIESLLCKLSM